jgi:adenylate cyclase
VGVTDFLAQYPDDGVAQYHAKRLRVELQALRRVASGAMQ